MRRKKKNINIAIDEHVTKERYQLIKATIISVVFFMIFFILFMLPPMGKTSQHIGVVTRLVGLPTEEGQNLYLLVKLDSGIEVRSYIENTSHYKQGKRVQLEKQESLIFGKPVYRFRGYIKNGA